MQLPAHRAEPSLRYVAVSLTVGVFFAGVAGGVAYPTLPQLGTVLGISPVVVGLILATNGVKRLLVNAPAGSLFDRVGSRKPMLAGFSVLALVPFGYALGMNPGSIPLSASAVFLLSRAAWGVGTALATVGGFATITHVTTSANRGRWLGYVTGAFGFGLPVGLVVGGVVADARGISDAVLLAGALGVLSTLLAVALLPDLTPAVEQPLGLGAIPGIVRTDHRVPVVGTVTAAGRFLTGVFLSTVVLYAAEHGITLGGFSETAVSGVVLAVSVVCASASNVTVGRYSDTVENRIGVVLPALVVVGVGFVLVASVPTLAGITVGVAIAGLGGGAVGPPSLAYLGDISPDENVGKFVFGRQSLAPGTDLVESTLRVEHGRRGPTEPALHVDVGPFESHVLYARSRDDRLDEFQAGLPEFVAPFAPLANELALQLLQVVAEVPGVVVVDPVVQLGERDHGLLAHPRFVFLPERQQDGQARLVPEEGERLGRTWPGGASGRLQRRLGRVQIRHTTNRIARVNNL